MSLPPQENKNLRMCFAELFDMEGLHDMDDVRPFYNSDDENDTDGNILNIGSIMLSFVIRW